jgi:hypothetical protein
MAKKKIETIEDIVIDERKLEIKDATIKDGFCHYGYEILKGAGKGDIINRKGSNIVHPDMDRAFKRLHVHLAVIDDVFHFSGIAIDNIDTFHDHEITDMFHVHGIKLKGTQENERVVILGSKHITSSGRINLETPAISLTTSYKWYNELKTAVDAIRREVELYMEGKRDESDDDNQGSLFDNIDANFENAAL